MSANKQVRINQQQWPTDDSCGERLSLMNLVQAYILILFIIYLQVSLMAPVGFSLLEAEMVLVDSVLDGVDVRSTARDEARRIFSDPC